MIESGHNANPKISVTRPVTVTASACGWLRDLAMCPRQPSHDEENRNAACDKDEENDPGENIENTHAALLNR
jgi:hypothetical protein